MSNLFNAQKMITLLFTLAIIAGLLLIEIFLTGCSPVGKPMRQSLTSLDADGKKLPLPDELGKRAFIEATNAVNPYSCSFVEFDGRGDYIDFQQHHDCWNKIKKFAEDEGVLLVIYCHGWKNNSQSGDVLKFNTFLSQLSKTKKVQDSKMRVHGVYLSWRGNIVKPFVDLSSDDQYVDATTTDFGELIVDRSRSRRTKLPGFLVEQLSYWSRKDSAENKVSGVPLVRSVMTFANVAQKTKNRRDKDNRVFLMGHSFGALMLEQSVLPGIVSPLTAQWAWDKSHGSSNSKSLAGILPFDLILLVNSAAPSIYAKEMSDFLAAHGAAQGKKKSPIVISLTSRSDWATRGAHRVGNLLSPFSPSLRKNYRKRVWDLGDGQRNQDHAPVHQSEFYKRTPGHNPFLISKWIIPRETPLPPLENESAFSANLKLENGEAAFYVTDRQDSSNKKSWKLVEAEDLDTPSFRYKGQEVTPFKTPYWFVRCEKELIANHGDIWSPQAMDVYAALFRFSEISR